MGRKPRVDGSPEEKWQIVQEGLKSGNVSETCRRHGIAANLFYRWKDEAEQGAKAALGGRSAAAAETEKDHTKQHTPMPNEEHCHAVGALRPEHQLQNRLREKTRGKSTGSRRNA